MNPIMQMANKLRRWASPRSLPRMLLKEEQIREVMRSRSAAAHLAKHLVERLRTYPHFIILKRTSHIGNGAPIERLIKAIAQIPPFKTGQTPEDRPKVEVTRIQVSPDVPAEVGSTTQYSRTNQPLALHTDDSFNLEPRELVVFDFARADPHGGDSLLAAVEDVVAALDEEMKERLKKPVFPFGHGDHPVLWEQNGTPNIRYSRLQIDKMRADSEHRLSEDDIAALEALDGALCTKEVLFQVHIKAGETLLLHNTKVLHGRTGFSQLSDRLMYRARMRAGCLS
jgi:alpha-ketoglutarate-dependent taurine dioxygenase